MATTEYMREYRRRQRKDAIEMYGGVCFICGQHFPGNWSMMLHKKDCKSHAKVQNTARLALKNPKDFVLLCKACHRGVHFCDRYLDMTWEELEELAKANSYS